MNINNLKLYLALSRLPLLRNNYNFKIIAVALTGILIPLTTLIVYALVNSSLSFHYNLNFFIVILFATLVGAIITFLLLHWLLYPITLIVTAQREYFTNEKKSQLPTDGKDTVGQLMSYAQYTIEKLDLLNNSFKYSSTIDPLTGIPNRRAGKERLRLDMARTRRGKNSMLVVMVDFDSLKNITKQYGPHIGDICITQIANVLSKSIRGGDWLARWDEEQFLMVLWNFNHKNPTTVLERIQQQSIKTPLRELLQINLCIGACEYSGNKDLDPETDLETLFSRLEKALSQVKLTQEKGGIVLG
ncbi:diguanylate cyclase [Candidatus Parabeggiatoa sp. HSG14]|uniref:GGDEF domain-containing protein n=1 Tax=Candidatus Parabeggiatoa sp. HSG14 TaxID=3055593 RepID=UPI0025A871FB|nr:diguanylate cyclase [Thiotrichales bacterium HSG14]